MIEFMPEVEVIYYLNEERMSLNYIYIYGDMLGRENLWVASRIRTRVLRVGVQHANHLTNHFS